MKALLKVKFVEELVRDDANFYIRVTPQVRHVKNIIEKKDIDEIVKEINKQFKIRGVI